jgi:hypothetical protein
MAVLNSAEAAINLLDKRNSICSDRPRFVLLWICKSLPYASIRLACIPIVHEIGHFPSLGLLGLGKRCQKHRRTFHSVFSLSETHVFEDSQPEEARFLLKNLTETGTPATYDSLVRK